MRAGVRNRLLPIIKGHNVFRLAGGSPCFQRASRRLFVIFSPVLVDFSERKSFFLVVEFQQEQIASRPLAMYPFYFGFRFL